ncbi:MAG: HAMP domain-containing sensor histidine kinase [Myxococcota bacterium]
MTECGARDSFPRVAGTSVRSDPDQLATRRLVAMVVLTLLVQPLSLGVGFSMDAALLGPPMMLVAIPAVLLYGFILVGVRRGMRPQPLGHIFAFAATLQVTTGGWLLGGLLSGSAVFGLTIPVAATLVSGPRAGWLWLVVQVGAWGAWTTAFPGHEVAAGLMETMPSWKGGMLFALMIAGVFFQAGVSILHSVEREHRRVLALTLQGLERRVEERTADLVREVDERREAEAAAQLASRAKSTFLANMSHELRTPVTTVIGYTELAQEDVADLVVREDLDRVLGAAQHLLGLIDTILDLSRVESGIIELEPQEITTEALVQPLVTMMRPLLESHGNTFVVEVAGFTLSVDPGRTRQVLLNLLTNANKFTTRGRIALAVRREDDQAIFEVVDTGPGIPAEQLDAIFGRFVQAHDERVDHPGGTGLGLTIAKQIAVRMSGQLQVHSVVGEGSTFALSLPLGDAETL